MFQLACIDQNFSDFFSNILIFSASVVVGREEKKEEGKGNAAGVGFGRIFCNILQFLISYCIV